MKLLWYRSALRTSTLVLLMVSSAHAQLPKCSTQKVNGDCALVFDRLDPISLPTIQMRAEARINVTVVGPLPYETLSLDPTTFQGIAPTDQTQAFFTSLFPSLKGVSTPTVTPNARLAPVAGDSGDLQTVKKDLTSLQSSLDNPFPAIQTFITNAQGFYAQLDEAVAPLPRPRDSAGVPKRVSTSPIPHGTPYPWSDSYPNWVSLLLCELSAPECTENVNATFNDLMGTGINIQTLLTPPTPAPGAAGPPPSAPLQFDTATFNALVAKTTADINLLQPQDHPGIYSAELVKLQAREALLVKAVPAYAAAWLPGVTAINKDLQTYFVNIKQTASAAPSKNPLDLGYIDDPRRLSTKTKTSTKFLGRQVTYSVNAVNQIAVMTTAVPTTAQKTSIVTITVLYADPVFEVSTGALLSTLPSRTFANQTLVTTTPGAMPTTGNIVITQSIIRPTVLPYVAANFRLGHDFLLFQRRGAVYLTGAVAFNGYNTTAEYAVGPSLSWRMIMISPLVHLGHDVHLTQGETVGMVWCNSSAAPGTPTACVGAPPAPSTKTYWRGAFALGIGIRVPTSFGTTAGH
jgi:hypothetical protein